MIGKTLFAALILAAALSPVFADSLSVSPPHPTTADKITFTIIIPNWDCCTRYTWDSTAVAVVNDTELLLSYQYNLPQMCPMIACMDIDKLLPFHSAPLKAGTYAVYELRAPLCTTQICPAIAFMPVKIGSVTVTPSTGIVNGITAASVPHVALAEKLYDVRGVLISSTGNRAAVRTPGVYLIKNGSQSSRLILEP
ncbi:MAG TPA: hypothetical protein VLX68_06170 [Chitinivibrionales bacterium]|nr:hypothetical protein [Chitinivibrionales bacterium]